MVWELFRSEFAAPEFTAPGTVRPSLFKAVNTITPPAWIVFAPAQKIVGKAVKQGK